MAIEQDKLGVEVYKILAAKDYGYTLSIYDTAGEGTTTPMKAKWIYIKPVNFMVQLPDPDKKERPEMYFWKQQGEHDEVIEQLIERLRNAANQFGVGLTVNDFARDNTPKQFAKLVKRYNEESDTLNESMTGSSRRSYYVLENARMVAIHSKRINEEIHGARSRDIKEIFVENSLGERFRFPTSNLQGARTMTRHLSEGGSWGDATGKAIRENCMALVSLRKLKEAAAQGKPNVVILEKANSYISEVKRDLKSGQGPRGYAKLVEKYSQQIALSRVCVEQRCQSLSSLSGLMESEELLEAYKYMAVRDLREDKLNESLYTQIIAERCGVDSRVARGASCAITKGNVGFVSEPKFALQPNDTRQRVLVYASALAEAVDNDLVAIALSEIAEGTEPTRDEANFVYGVYKSAKLKNFNNPASTEPVMQELMDWVNKTTKGFL